MSDSESLAALVYCTHHRMLERRMFFLPLWKENRKMVVLVIYFKIQKLLEVRLFKVHLDYRAY